MSSELKCEEMLKEPARQLKLVGMYTQNSKDQSEGTTLANREILPADNTRNGSAIVDS